MPSKTTTPSLARAANLQLDLHHVTLGPDPAGLGSADDDAVEITEAVHGPASPSPSAKDQDVGIAATSDTPAADGADLSPDDESDGLPDLARDVDDPLPHGMPGQRTTTEEPTGPAIREEEFFPPPAAAAPEDVIATAPAEPDETPLDIDVGRLNLSDEQRSTLRAGGVVRVHAPLDAVSWSSLALGRSDRVAPTLIEDRASEIRAMGQKKACRARLLDSDVDLLTGMVEWLAARHIAGEDGTAGTIVVELELLDDETARKVVHADAAQGVAISPIDRARWTSAAIKETFGTQRKAAKALGMHESNMTRLLYVEEVATLIGGAIEDDWSISRKQAGTFMALWGDKSLRADIRRFIDGLPPASASKTFRAIFDRFGGGTPKRAGDVEIVGDDDAILGRVRATKAGVTMIELAKDAAQVELPTLIVFVEAALAKVRSNLI